MALTANLDVDHHIDQEIVSYKVKAAARIFKGALVGHSLGYARPLVAGDPFLGLAYEEIDNTAGADGDKAVRVFSQGDFDIALSGAAITNVDDPVYASDDGTLTFTPTANSFVGRCVNFVSAGIITLRLDTLNPTP